MALSKLPEMPTGLGVGGLGGGLGLGGEGGLLGNSNLDDQKQETDILGLLSELAKAKEKMSSSKKKKSSSETVAKAKSSFKKSAQDLMHATRSKRFKALAAFKDRLGEQRLATKAMVMRCEELERTLSAKATSYEEQRKSLQTQVDASTLEFRKMRDEAEASVQMADEFRKVQDAVRAKLSELQKFISEIERERKAAARMHLIVSQVKGAVKLR